MQPFYFNYDKEAAKTSFAAYFATFAVVVFMLHSVFGTKVCCFFSPIFVRNFANAEDCLRSRIDNLETSLRQQKADRETVDRVGLRHLCISSAAVMHLFSRKAMQFVFFCNFILTDAATVDQKQHCTYIPSSK